MRSERPSFMHSPSLSEYLRRMLHYAGDFGIVRTRFCNALAKLLGLEAHRTSFLYFFHQGTNGYRLHICTDALLVHCTKDAAPAVNASTITVKLCMLECQSARKVYQLTSYRKQTKNQWDRNSALNVLTSSTERRRERERIIIENRENKLREIPIKSILNKNPKQIAVVEGQRWSSFRGGPRPKTWGAVIGALHRTVSLRSWFSSCRSLQLLMASPLKQEAGPKGQGNDKAMQQPPKEWQLIQLIQAEQLRCRLPSHFGPIHFLSLPSLWSRGFQCRNLSLLHFFHSKLPLSFTIPFCNWKQNQGQRGQRPTSI